MKQIVWHYAPWQYLPAMVRIGFLNQATRKPMARSLCYGSRATSIGNLRRPSLYRTVMVWFALRSSSRHGNLAASGLVSLRTIPACWAGEMHAVPPRHPGNAADEWRRWVGNSERNRMTGLPLSSTSRWPIFFSRYGSTSFAGNQQTPPRWLPCGSNRLDRPRHPEFLASSWPGPSGGNCAGWEAARADSSPVLANLPANFLPAVTFCYLSRRLVADNSFLQN